MLQKEGNLSRARYLLVLAVSLAAVLLLGVGKVQAATKLALFNFETAHDLKVVKGAKLDLAADSNASGWASSNSKVVKVTKKGIAKAVKPGKAVVSANINGQKKECQITVTKDVLKGSKYIQNVYKTWETLEGGKKVTVKSGNFMQGLGDFLSKIEKENDDDVVLNKCSKITAIEEDSAGATVYFEAAGVFNGKEMKFPCSAVFTNDYEHDKYDYSLMLQHVVWVADDGQLVYGTALNWYA